MNAEMLDVLARAALMLGTPNDTSGLHLAGILAQNEARAANGCSTVATLHWKMVVDNDRAGSTLVRAFTVGPMPKSEEDFNARVSRVADALREWSETDCGLMDGSLDVGCGLAAAMIRRGLAEVDWTWLARHYLEENNNG